MNLEVWFPHQDQASVFLESSVIGDGDDERFYETSLFALFAARQIANLSGDWVAQSLGATLMNIDASRPLHDVRETLGDVQLVAPSNGGGRKGFTAEFRPEKRAFFKMHIHGMGFLGKGAGYYAPTSTLALLAYLLGRRPEDSEYQYALASVAQFIGVAGTQGGITVMSQTQMAMQAAAAGWTAESERATELNGDAEDNSGSEESNGASTTAAYEVFDDDLAALLANEAVMANVGEQIVLNDDGKSLGFRLIALHDPVEPTDDEFGAARGHRYVGVEMEIENLSTEEFSALLTVGLINDEGQAYVDSPAARDPEFNLYPGLEPGERSAGFLLFELHKGDRPERFVIGIDNSPTAAVWPFATGKAEDAAASDHRADAIDQIGRLSDLHDQGALTDEEFQAKKAELLDRL